MHLEETVVDDVLGDVLRDAVELRDCRYRRHIVDVVDAVELGRVFVPVSRKYRLFEVYAARGDVRLIIAEAALGTGKSADVRVLVELVSERLSAERAEASLGRLEYLLGREGVLLRAEIPDVLVVGISPAETGGVGVVAVEDEVAAEGLAEAVYLLYEGLHFAVAVELIAEEVEHDERLELELRVHHGDVALVRLENEVVRIDSARAVAVAEQEGAYARVEVVALAVDYDFLAALLKELGDAVGDGGLAVGACHGDNGAVDLEHFAAFSVCEVPQDNAREVARVAPE